VFTGSSWIRRNLLTILGFGEARGFTGSSWIRWKFLDSQESLAFAGISCPKLVLSEGANVLCFPAMSAGPGWLKS
jgi:hypothetical protein